uniref:Virion structural protein n=1 Tax=Pantoea phage Survivor TaxID=3232176 RepID=A0AAU8L0R3_9CAUD
MSTNLYSCFCVNKDLVINGSTSPIGELTNKSISYSKEPDFYFKDGKPVGLVGFRGVSDTSMYEQIPKTHYEPIIEMMAWLFEQAKAKKTTDSPQGCLQLLKANYTTGWEWKAVNQMVTNNDIWMPSSINFTYAAGGVVHEFKIWFANDFFAVEFPYREIYVVHPIPIDDIDFLADSNYKQVRDRLNAETTDKIQDRVDKVLGGKGTYQPPTERIVMGFDIYDLINVPQKNMGFWTIIYYGNPNDAEEETYEAIKKCILDHSKYPEDKWADVIPDLFNPLEFAVVPYWNELGLVNETVAGSTYTPIFTYKDGTVLPLKYCALWGNDAVIESLQIVPHLYKSAKMGFVGKPKNHNALHHINQVFPDYQLIPSTDSQAGMMSKDTAKFIFDLEEMLAAGEVVTPNGMPPKGIQRVMRDGKLYITRRSSKVKITMITRYQFVKDGVIVE